MRYLFGFLCVCALGLVPLVGCDVGVGDLCLFEPCPDKCEGVVCPDDGNACTEEGCDGGSCDRSHGARRMELRLRWRCRRPVYPASAKRTSGAEASPVRKNAIEGHCDLVAGACEYYIAVEDGTTCSGGICLERVCVTLTDQCTADDLAAIDAGDEPGSDCTEGVEWTFECFNCCRRLLAGAVRNRPQQSVPALLRIGGVLHAERVRQRMRRSTPTR